MSIMIGIITITEPYPTAYAGKDSTKELCKENGGEWEDGECDIYENQMKEGWEVDEDNFYKEVCQDEEKESDECKKHRLSIEDGE
jgi:hypothetical protein